VTYTWTEATLKINPPTGGALGCNPLAASLPTVAGVSNAVTYTDTCSTVTNLVTALTTTNGCAVTEVFTIKAGDQCGDTATATVTYTWTTATLAFKAVPTGSALGCNPATASLPTITSVSNAVTYTDTCSTVTNKVTSQTTTNGCAVTEVFTINAGDLCGDKVSTTVTYTWTTDTTGPGLTCPPSITLLYTNNCQVYCSFTPQDWCVTGTGHNGVPTFWNNWCNNNGSANCFSAWTTWWSSCTGTSPGNNWWNTCTQGSGKDWCGGWTSTSSWQNNWCSSWNSGNGTGNNWLPCNGQNPSTVLGNCFSAVYPGGCIQIGNPNGGYCLKLTSASAVCSALGTTGNNCAFSCNATNPSSCGGGNFCAQVLALQLNCDFGDHYCGSSFGGRCGDLVCYDTTTSCTGWTVRQICALANSCLGGAPLPSGCTLSSLCNLCSNLNQCCEACQPSSWCMANCVCAPAIPPVSVTGTPTVGSTCGGTPTLTNTDSTLTAGSCNTFTYTIIWKATDACGVSSTCEQLVTLIPTNTPPPVITSTPQGCTLGCNPTAASLPTDASVQAGVTTTSPCGPATVTVTSVATTNGCAVTETFTITATSVYGATTTATVVYTWTVDKTAPVITCPANVTINNNVNNCQMYCTCTPQDWCATGNSWNGVPTFWNNWCQNNNTGNSYNAWTSWWTSCTGQNPGSSWWNNCTQGNGRDWCGGWTSGGYQNNWYSGWNSGNYGQNSWLPCNGQNPNTILGNCFSAVYPSGCIQIGNPNGGYCLKLTSASAVCNALQTSGNNCAFNCSAVNPSSCGGGNFCAQVLALQLNCDFGDHYCGSSFGGRCGDLICNDSTTCCQGWTVRQICALANSCLGGGQLPSGCTLNSLCTLCSNLNQCFEGCQPSSYCSSKLRGVCLPQPSQTGTATAVNNCAGGSTITYTDSVAAGRSSGTYIDTRTWTAVDPCGNSNSCTQVITINQ
jgi:hypothetical protein